MILEELFENYFINQDLLLDELNKTNSYQEEQKVLIEMEEKLLIALKSEILLFDYEGQFYKVSYLEQLATFKIAFKMGAKLMLEIKAEKEITIKMD